MVSLPGIRILTRSIQTELGLDKGTLTCCSQKKGVMNAEHFKTTNMPDGYFVSPGFREKATDP